MSLVGGSDESDFEDAGASAPAPLKTRPKRKRRSKDSSKKGTAAGTNTRSARGTVTHANRSYYLVQQLLPRWGEMKG